MNMPSTTNSESLKESPGKPYASDTESKVQGVLAELEWNRDRVQQAAKEGRQIAVHEVIRGVSGSVTFQRVHTIRDLDSRRSVILEAEQLWKRRVVEFGKSQMNAGSSVLGAGIEVYVLLEGAQEPMWRMIIDAPVDLQGSLSWEGSVNEVLAFLNAHGLECRYAFGELD